jgi:hypothetical protein
MQRGFIDFVVTPTLRPLAEFCKKNGAGWMSQLQRNYAHWQSLQVRVRDTPHCEGERHSALRG